MESSRPRIAVIGSANMDMVVKSARIPALGETVLGGDFLMTPGGKGANQAVAAAKLKTEVHFICNLGDDVFGTELLGNFRDLGMAVEHVRQVESVPTGVALIMVDEAGTNIIVVAPGSNGMLAEKDVDAAAEAIAASKVLVAQLEIPLATVEHAAAVAHKHGVVFILDPAPAQALSDELLGKVDILKPNETEAEILTGTKVVDEASAKLAAGQLLDRGVKCVIITMSGAGFLLARAEGTEFIPGMQVKAVDTTAAGDAFTGALAAGLAAGKDVREAALFANKVAALSVTKMGAQSSMPMLAEVESFGGNE